VDKASVGPGQGVGWVAVDRASVGRIGRRLAVDRAAVGRTWVWLSTFVSLNSRLESNEEEEDSWQHLSLVVGGSRELLALLGRDGGVARDQPREDATWFGVGLEDSVPGIRFVVRMVVLRGIERVKSERTADALS